MILESDAFSDGGTIPRRYAGDGEDASPPLSWREVPPGTETLALVVSDPDAPAGTWVHWVLFNVPSDATGLAERTSGPSGPPSGAVEGLNSWGRPGYRGPSPPSGTHRYFFRLYALDTALDLGPGADADDVARAIEGHELGECTLMGRYSKAST